MKKNFVDICGHNEDNDDEEQISEKKDLKNFETKTGAVIYLLDAREKMFLPSFEEAKLPIIRCLESVRQAVRKKIFQHEKCFCCVALLGTKKAQNVLKLDNIFVVQELEYIGADHVMKIDDLIKAVENLSYKAKYGHSKFSLGEALWLSSHIFNHKSRNLNKTVVFFTNDENPTSDDPNDRNRAVANAQDFFKSHVTFDFIPLGKNFDCSKFYKKIIQASKNDVKCVIPDPVTNVSEIVCRITKTNFKHINLVKLPFVISDDFVTGVSVHFLVRKAKLPFKIKLSKATNEKVFTRTEYFEEETGSLVPKDDLIKSQVVAQKDINFTLSELKAIQGIGKKEIRLLGFKPASVVRLENFVKPCAFIYPDDTEYKGSSVFFTALLKRCIAKQVVPICTFCPRAASACRFVALIAQDECSEDGRGQQLPPGFVVFFLPFAEEMRTFEENSTDRANAEQVEIAAKLIKKLRFLYKPSYFPNPRLKHHWAAIEALALDLEQPEEFSDNSIPNHDLMSQRSGQIAKEFMEAVYKEDYKAEDFTRPKKRKPENVLLTPKEILEIETCVREEKGHLLTKNLLKQYLRSVGTTKNLSHINKLKLLGRIKAHLVSK